MNKKFLNLKKIFFVVCRNKMVIEFKNVLTRQEIWAVSILKIKTLDQTKREKQTGQARKIWNKSFVLLLSASSIFAKLYIANMFRWVHKRCVFFSETNMACTRMFPARTDKSKEKSGLKQTPRLQILHFWFLRRMEQSLLESIESRLSKQTK